MMFEPWQKTFHETLSRLHNHNLRPRIALVGVGHELRGDDAAGLHFVRVVSQEPNLSTLYPELLVIEAGSAPENFSGVLRRFGPHLVVLVDAALLEVEAGVLGWVPWRDTTGLSASTHTLPLKILATYLEAELGCQIALLGIQPANLATGEPLTLQVAHAVEAAAQTWLQIFTSFSSDLENSMPKIV